MVHGGALMSALAACIVGIGPGSREHVTPAARTAIAGAGLVLGWDLDLLPVEDCLAGKRVFLQDVTNYVEQTRLAVDAAIRDRARLAIPRVGDPCLSSGLKGLLRALEGFTVEIVPGISSIQLAAAHARVNLDESVVVSFHDYGDPDDKKRFVLDSFRSGRHVILLASPDLTVGAAASWLLRAGAAADTRVVVGSRLSHADEQVCRAPLAEMADREFPWLSVSVFLNPAVPTIEEDYRRWRQWRAARGFPPSVSRT
jgi:cobalt-precorrin-7 (C5)-methyltransferase